MVCQGFKGSIGTASRVVSAASGGYTVGVLVQANHGPRQRLPITEFRSVRLSPPQRYQPLDCLANYAV